MKNILYFIFVSIFIFSGCSPRIPELTSQQIADLQKSVTFPIVLPTYLPNDLKLFPQTINGPLKGPNNEQMLLINYYSSISNGAYIFIQEFNRASEWHPSDPSGTFINITGVEVLEQPIQSFPPNQPPTLQYGWSARNVTYIIQSSGYATTEIRKLVESMIKVADASSPK